MDYRPQPFDDSKNPLPGELEPLKEELSKNVHEV